MPAPIPTALDDSAAAAAAKSTAARHLAPYLVSAALAGAYVGVAVVLLLSAAGPLAAAGFPGTRLVQGAVFGVALTLVVFAGAELFTGNVMTMLHGRARGTVTRRQAARVWAASLAGNLAGSLGFAAIVHASGTLSSGATPDKPGPAAALLSSIVAAKDAAAGPQLFWRAVLCNALVCLGLWMALRAASDGAKLIVLGWALLAFITSGFEHSIANMTLFGLAALGGTADWWDLARNLAWTLPGNVVGGALIGLGYARIGRPARVASPAHPSTHDADADAAAGAELGTSTRQNGGPMAAVR